MARYLLAVGVTAMFLGGGLVPPALVAGLTQGQMSPLGIAVLSLAGVFVVLGLGAIVLGRLRSDRVPRPAPVRAVILANLFFLAFCTLEASDGLLRQEGRLFYWTSVLFLPALLLHFGVIFARRWAWWSARGSALLFVVWFSVFLLLIPFADLRSSGEPVPWYGRAYMIGASLIFAGISAYVFHALGRTETRGYFGLPRRQQVPTFS